MTDQSLQSALQQQVDNLKKLSELLDQELHLISSRDAEALMTLLNEKEQTLEAIHQLEGMMNGRFRQPLSEGTLSEEEQQLLDEAKTQLEQCKYRTQINQTAVEQGQLRLTHLRNLMMEVRAKESMTYDKKGKPSGSSAGKGIKA